MTPVAVRDLVAFARYGDIYPSGEGQPRGLGRHHGAYGDTKITGDKRSALS